MDFLILAIVNKVCHRHSSMLRLLAGAGFGALGLCLLIFMPRFLYHILGYIIISGVMVTLTFKPRGLGDFIRLFFMTYFVAILLGGAIYGLSYTTIGSHLYKVFYYGINHLSWWAVLLGGILIYVLTTLFMNWFGRDIKGGKSYYKTTIGIGDQSCTLQLLLDTGNSLVDPISKLPVIIVEYAPLKDILDKELLDQLYRTHRVHQVAYTVLGGEDVMTAFEPDTVLIQGKGINKETDQLLVGISYNKLSKKDLYQGLMHPGLLVS